MSSSSLQIAYTPAATAGTLTLGQDAKGNRGENRSLLILILLLAGDHPTNATSGVSNVSLPTWDEVDMDMGDGLTGLGASVDADIEACDRWIGGEDLFALCPEH
jgi:hypothetical protein